MSSESSKSEIKEIQDKMGPINPIENLQKQKRDNNQNNYYLSNYFCYSTYYSQAQCKYCYTKNLEPKRVAFNATYEIETDKVDYESIIPWFIYQENFGNIYYCCEYCINEFKNKAFDISYNLLEFPFGFNEKYSGYQCNIM